MEVLLDWDSELEKEQEEHDADSDSLASETVKGDSTGLSNTKPNSLQANYQLNYETRGVLR